MALLHSQQKTFEEDVVYSIAILGLLVSLPLLIKGSDEGKKTKATERKSLLIRKEKYSEEYGSSDPSMIHLVVAPIKAQGLFFQEKQQPKSKQKKGENSSNGFHGKASFNSVDYDTELDNGSKHDDFELIPLDSQKKKRSQTTGTKIAEDTAPNHTRIAEKLYKAVLEKTHLYWDVKALDLSNAHITGIFHLGFLTFEMRNLEALYLDNNAITKLIGGINRHTALHYFSVANNKLVKVALVKVFTCFPNLKNLNIDHNEKVVLSSENITNSTQCTVSCRNCMLSEKDLKALAANAVLKPRSIIHNLFTPENRERETPAYEFRNC